MGLAGIFSVSAALVDKRTYILPAGVIFLITGVVLAGGPGLETRSGEDYSYTEFNGSNVKANTTYTYTAVETSFLGMQFSEALGATLALISLYVIALGAGGKNLRTLFK